MSAKEEALKALSHVAGMLDTDLDPLQRRLAKATVEHAKEQVEAIAELKRARPKPKVQEPA